MVDRSYTPTVRAASDADIETVVSIYNTARSFMRKSNNMNQWTGGYPGYKEAEADVSQNRLFLLEKEGEVLCAFTVVEYEPTYEYIEGAWLDADPYVAVHRIGTSGKVAGAGRRALEYVIDKYKNVRIDTHADNTPMRHVLTQLGFTECGTIYLESGAPRVAYQKNEKR